MPNGDETSSTNPNNQMSSHEKGLEAWQQTAFSNLNLGLEENVDQQLGDFESGWEQEATDYYENLRLVPGRNPNTKNTATPNQDAYSDEDERRSVFVNKVVVLIFLCCQLFGIRI